MKTILPPALVGFLLLHAAAVPLWADEEASAAAASAAKQPAVTGKILVLTNEGTLEGDIERIGSQYRLRRSIGETWVPGDRVLHLCSSNEEAYVFLRGRSNLKDPDERLKLAQWCHQRGLHVQALDEVRAAVKLRPEHAQSKRLLACLEQRAAENRANEGQPRPKEPEPTPEPDLKLTGEALGQFASRVQPILMNSCASCHAAGRGGSFKLQRAYETSNRRVTKQNIVAVLAQLRPQQPEVSPFLVKGLAVHGSMSQPPFKNRQAPAFRMLEDWVLLVSKNQPLAADALRVEVGPGWRGEATATPPANRFASLAAERPAATELPLAPGSAVLPSPLSVPNAAGLAATERPAAMDVPATGERRGVSPPVRSGTPAPASPPPVANEPTAPDPTDPYDKEWFNQETQRRNGQTNPLPGGPPER